MVSEMERLDKHRDKVRTRSGPANYVDTGGPGRPVLLAAPERRARRPNTAPAYYLGHPARLWITVTRPHRRGSASDRPEQAATGGGQTPSRHGGPVTGAGTETARAAPIAAPMPAIWPMIRELAWAHHGTNDGPRTPASARDAMWLAWAVHDQWPWGGQ